eukprot:jgi/Bigna1/72538/fgenesh1_pg.20_\
MPARGRMSTALASLAFTLAITPALAARVGNYSLTHRINSTTFLQEFEFFTAGDPTHGYVQFVSQSEAAQLRMLQLDAGSIYMSVDKDGNYDPNGPGRKSIRVQSRKVFNGGVFVIDLDHIPSGCGTWPAFWSVGPQWPDNGEIDILEGVHRNVQDISTLHTREKCSMQTVDTALFTGSWSTGFGGQNATDCYVKSTIEYANQGCGIISDDSASFGEAFNRRGGGTVATVWDDEGIRMYGWRRGAEPADVRKAATGKSKGGEVTIDPDGEGWGMPYALFQFGDNCDPSHFANHQLVFDLTLCGDWAGSTFSSVCSDIPSASCEAYIADHRNVQDAFWSVRSVDVYEIGGLTLARPAMGFQGKGCNDTDYGWGTHHATR